MESKMIEKLVEMEKTHSSDLSKSVEKLNNVVIKELLTGIAYDSQKHAGFYQTILTLIEKIEPAINEEEYARIEKALKRHIDVEKVMMEESKQLLSSIEDSRIRHLLKEIYADEIRHHSLMKRILEAVVKRETIFEADWWDFIWEGVPGHGTPIG